MVQAGVDPEQLFQVYLDVYNDCLRDRPRDMTIGLHICRGNVKASVSPIQHPNNSTPLSDRGCSLHGVESTTNRALGLTPRRSFPWHK